MQETSNSLVSTFISYDPTVLTQSQICQVIQSLLTRQDWGTATLPAGRKLWKIPAAFGGEHGPQLEEAADLAGVSVDQAIADFTETPLRVMSIGFAPGQPYLGALGAHWDIPRQQGLTAQVPAASIVVAIRQMTVFTNATPTGWRRVGQTAFELFRPDQDHPFRLGPSDEVQFLPVTASDIAKIQSRDDGGLGGASCEVITE